MYLLEESVAVSVCGNRQLAYDLDCRVTRAAWLTFLSLFPILQVRATYTQWDSQYCFIS